MGQEEIEPIMRSISSMIGLHTFGSEFSLNPAFAGVLPKNKVLFVISTSSILFPDPEKIVMKVVSWIHVRTVIYM